MRRAAHGPADRRVPSGTLRALAIPDPPVALLIDDAQWADRESLESLARLARRDVPVLLVVAARPAEALADLAGVRGVTLLEPGQLSAAGGPLPHTELRRRLGQLDAADRYVVRAMAVLGDGAEPHRIAGVAVEDLAGALERLAAGGLSLVRELVARGVRDEMPAAVRDRQHRAAATALLRDGEPAAGRRASLAATALTVFRGPAVLVQAALQVELGAALVRLGRRVEARGGLRRALATADAVSLADRARRELVASGARPRRTAIEGAGALTPRQRQICDLAAAGKSNRAIAHALFLSVKTVETHLSRAYGTLGVLDRQGMIAALAR